MIDIGDVFTLGFEVRDDTDTLTTPTTYSCTITLPDATSDTPTLTVYAVGVLRLDYATAQAGRHEYVVATTSPDSRHTGTFDVDAGASGIVSLADVKAHLNITTTANDEELRTVIDAATDFVESKIGPVVRRSITQQIIPARDGTLFLDGPVISVTSITDTYGYGRVYDVANYLPSESGMVRSPAYGSTSTYPVTVTYVGGRPVVPALIQQAALDYVKWMWESQRGPTGGEPQFDSGAGFDVGAPPTVPYRITQALEPYTSVAIA